MCGIAGMYRANAPVSRAQLQAMCDVMAHRGPDDSGVFIDEAQPGVALGHRRLSIIDLATSQQPLTSTCGTATIAFNGEIYNYRALRQELEQDGFAFSTQGDTEVILNLYLKLGPACVERLRGMFAFAIWDRRENQLFLAIDRVGIKPLYYAFNERRLVFGSELKTVLASGQVSQKIDAQAADDFFAYGFIRSPRSIYREVAKLDPGHWMLVRKNHRGHLLAEKKQYWRLPPRQPDPTITYEEAKGELERLLRQAVEIRLMSEVPLGAFLSGGLDSSTVVWLMSQVSASRVNTFSIGFDQEQFTELPFARAVAQKFDTHHQEETVTPDAVRILPQVIAAHDEPFGDPSSIPTWYVSQMARKHVTVTLSGDGGDELFAGYARYITLARENADAQRWPQGLRQLLATPRHFFAKESRTWNWLSRKSLSLAQRYALFRTNFNEAMRRQLFSREFQATIDPSITGDLFGQVRTETTAEDHLSPLMASDFCTYLPHDVLTKVDRMSMAHSLEARVPVLDHKVVEFTQTLPSHFLFHEGRTKRILRDIIQPHLPQEVLTHKKQGFSVPLKAWFAGELKPLLEEAIHSPVYQRSGLFEPTYVEHIYNLHQGGKADLSWQLWQLLIFAQWHERALGAAV